ncbi:unnamed protein product, partial [Mesorhabditis spiculigera]
MYTIPFARISNAIFLSISLQVSQLHLPDGGKKLRFITRGHMIGAAVFFFVGYAYIKSVINPDSMWGKAVNSIHEQTVQWTDTRSEEEKNAPNLDRLNSMK